MLESVQGRVLVEMSELAGRTRADMERFKAFLSRQNDNAVRLAYRTDPEEAPRRFVIVGSANDPACLPNDPSGNRRWIAVPITSRDPQRVRNYLDTWRPQLWAEALARRAEPAWLPDTLRDSQDEHNETFRATDALVEDVVDEFLRDHHGERFRFVDVMQFASDKNVFSQGRVRKVLVARGFEARLARIDGIVTRFWER